MYECSNALHRGLGKPHRHGGGSGEVRRIFAIANTEVGRIIFPVGMAKIIGFRGFAQVEVETALVDAPAPLALICSAESAKP